MTDEVREENSENKESHGRTWYPYITKTQFEKFLARLESKLPEQIDRDYVRAIIRTPSMIYRFLRGIEAMKLIDREQRPTERLARLVDRESRKRAIAEILRDLYADLLEQWQKSNGSMSDDEMISFFRSRTGMGRDSANKMKMFFKYLLGEADFSEPPPGAQTSSPEASPSKPTAVAQASDAQPALQPAQSQTQSAPQPAQPQAQPAPQPAQSQVQSTPQPAQPQPSPSTQEKRSSRERSAVQPSRNNGPQQQQQQPTSGIERQQSQRGMLNEAQKAYLQTLQTIVRINIDGDWDDDMIRAAFDRLERLFDRIKRS